MKHLLRTSIFKNISIVFVWDNVSKLAGIITTVLLIRFLPQADYALYTVFNSALVLFSGVVSSGIILAYVRFASEQYSVKKTTPATIFVFAVLTCLSIYSVLFPVVFFTKDYLAGILLNNKMYSLPLIFGFIGAIALFLQDIFVKFFQVREEYHKAGILAVIQKLLFLIAIIAVAIIIKLNFLVTTFVQITISLISAFMMIWIFLRQDLKIDFKRDYCELINFIKSSGWLVAYCVCLAFISQLDVFMVSRFKGIVQVAEYGVATKYYNLILMMLPSIMTVIRIHTSKITMVESLEKQKLFVLKWIKIGVLFFVPIVILVLIFATPIMRFLNGKQYDGAIVPFKILAISSCFSYIFAPNIGVFMAMKKYVMLFRIGLSALFFNIILNLFLVPQYGIKGAAIATLFSNLMVNGFSTIYILAANKE